MLTEYKASGMIFLKSRRMARASCILAAKTAAIFHDKFVSRFHSHLCGHSHIERPVLDSGRRRMVGRLPQVVIEQCRSKFKLSLLPVYPVLFLSVSVISEGMGHDSETTTQIYLASLDTSVVDKANSLILKSL